MPFKIETAGDAVVVAVVGQLVVGNRQEFKQTVLDQVEQGARRILIDFAETGYVDSSGLGALVSLNKRVTEAGGALRLAALNEDMRTLFELTRLDTLFQLYPSRAEALAAF
ncbi:MAG: STAS domain-containing protein [Gemmatimonas sp.]